METIIGWFKTNLGERFSASPYNVIMMAILTIVILALLASLAFKRWKSQRANQFLTIVIAALLLLIVSAEPTFRWQLVVALLPAIMVAYQAFFLWLYHPKSKKKSSDSMNGQATDYGPTSDDVERAQRAVDSHFGLRTLSIRYGFPAILLGLTGIVVLNVLVSPTLFLPSLTAEAVTGIKFGAVGSYIYVLIELGRRTFRHDVTGASAMWCLVTLILGPVLAATVAILWHMKQPDDQGWWAGGVVLFFAGFAPRRVIAAIEQAAIQLLKVGGQTAVVENRQIPLGKIRGIGPQVEERLSEEGILDVNSLATAEPLRLIRNTSFDMKQILGWIDEAILLVTLPKGWEALEDHGITGAIDLAWYNNQLDTVAQPFTDAGLPQEIKDIANAAKISPASNLASTIVRLYEDRQVQYIWALYNSFSEFAGGDDEGQSVSAPRWTKCFIPEIKDGFDRLLIEEIIKQELPLTIVTEPGDAAYEITCSSTTAEDKSKAYNVRLIEPKSGSVIWAGDASEKSIWPAFVGRSGPRGAAARIVSKMKNALAGKG
ncbi:MAG: hypothetical protein DMF61_16080 [Blastocatellia bacterium AA13]|nr:MAG: hypothetical protein DMF61_16080 [Blastocatellia bacterium AA13]